MGFQGDGFGVVGHGGEIAVDLAFGARILAEAEKGFGPFEEAFVAVGGEFFGLGEAIAGEAPAAEEGIEDGQFLPKLWVAGVALDGGLEKFDGFAAGFEAMEVFGEGDGGLGIPFVAGEGIFQPGAGVVVAFGVVEIPADGDGQADVEIAGVFAGGADEVDAGLGVAALVGAAEGEECAGVEAMGPVGMGGGGGGFGAGGVAGFEQVPCGLHGEPGIVRADGLAAGEDGAGVFVGKGCHAVGEGAEVVVEACEGFGVGELAAEGVAEVLADERFDLGGVAPGIEEHFAGQILGGRDGAGGFGFEGAEEFEAVEDGGGEEVGALESEVGVVEEEFAPGDSMGGADGEQGFDVEEGGGRLDGALADDGVEGRIGAEAEGVGVACAGEEGGGFGGAVFAEGELGGAEKGLGVGGVPADGAGV